MARLTIHDVAIEAGVSDSTVSRALRGLDRVDPGTRMRVEEAAKRLHFTFSRNASSLASGRTMRVTLLFAGAVNTWFNSSVMQGAYEVLAPAGYDIVPLITPDKQSQDRYFEMLPGNRNADAIIVTSFDLDKDKLRLLEGLTMPTIGLDSRTQDGYDASVRLDARQAMMEAVQLLHSLGHHRLGYVQQASMHEFAFSVKSRSESFLTAAKTCGYRQRDLVMLGEGVRGDGYSFEDAVSTAAASLLSTPDRPTALCVETDEFAVALIARLRRFGVRVPEDMTVIGFDDSGIAPVADLTTIHQDPVHMARLAATQAIALMNHLRMEQPHTLVGTRLILRGTSAPAPSVQR
ncbi:LacI family DNA-binding transcriptional regulator [Bifidobacterium crudilactis]|jgi:LacI family transcriptional regulator, repressor for deo operon, udp, cdd, tsx, nupC, and nupG|uniref:LacI family transcriptional regulator n=1 Tax=Bifidobacterium crudilactis TaxID=327277 RepID=A0A971CXV0_9BIFI|nr:LacI family DNA-binding transcriptional regulator [Bifidobacterium crudilactis]MCI1867632.1 LacI family transcriptional regulator [Bifidobacterium crudilactis]MDN5971929.1 LacI family transcriptional regulator [Bifidobacterium crudilactis]MDN6000091.1 LacI family transcriptional regulator [Bifidobacterium crudilactis]MDN6209456.1 LacI family transcriptional regulator [Bifidobacterium crudilactis]MDN6459648.1 LacI family transcriptional regulator [Bifidobacterium crudilactis]